MDGYHTNGGSLDNMLDDVDSQATDPMRAKNAIEHLQQKIVRTRELIKMEQISKEGSEYQQFLTGRLRGLMKTSSS
jgi:hypothetical protein